jgi:phosphatidylserine synthase
MELAVLAVVVVIVLALAAFGTSEQGKDHTKGIALAMGVLGLLLLTVGWIELGGWAAFLGFILIGLTFLFGALS